MSHIALIACELLFIDGTYLLIYCCHGLGLNALCIRVYP